MSFISASDITVISLTSSVMALVIVIVLAVILLRKRKDSDYDRLVDVSAIVREFTQRQKRLEERMIDEKVRLEILELRALRGKVEGNVVNSQAVPLNLRQGQDHVVPELPLEPQSSAVFSASRLSSIKSYSSDENDSVGRDQGVLSVVPTVPLTKKDATVVEILQAVLDGHDRATARQIQQRIGRSREHTARMMNLLYKQGLVSRDIGARPFTYSLTDTGRKELSSS